VDLNGNPPSPLALVTPGQTTDVERLARAVVIEQRSWRSR
jgi:hypothetical protein